MRIDFKSIIEKGIPIPFRMRNTNPFYVKIITLLDKLEISDSILFEPAPGDGYNFSVRLRALVKIYGIIKNQEFETRREDSTNLRLWRIK